MKTLILLALILNAGQTAAQELPEIDTGTTSSATSSSAGEMNSSAVEASSVTVDPFPSESIPPLSFPEEQINPQNPPVDPSLEAAKAASEATVNPMTSIQDAPAIQPANAENVEAPVEVEQANSNGQEAAASVAEEIPEVDSGLDVPPIQSESRPVWGKSSESENGKSDDFEDMKSDMGDEFVPASDVAVDSEEKEKAEKKEEVKQAPEEVKVAEQPAVFDVGREERDLLSLAQNIQGQISNSEWSEVATAAKTDSYTVVQDDWLFKISKKLFGSGFYYPKIWSLNSYITNPHFIEPGMVLTFSTGSSSSAPEVRVGSFTKDEIAAAPGSAGNMNATDLSNFGDDAAPKWLTEKGDLEKQGIYFQYASEETIDDLTKMGEEALNREYENYEPPRSEFDKAIPSNYDKNGFDKNSKIYYSFKEGYYLSTFVTTNIVQDFGSIVNGTDENIFFTIKDRAYIELDSSINALPGDKFSIYSTGGKVKHKNSDRQGYKYTIVAQVKLIRKIRNKWEVEFIEVAGTPQRGDRVTTYTPKIDRITHTYNSRLIEAAIIAPFMPMQSVMGPGNVIYLDRGRADGVEMGNSFEVYGFKDRLTNKNITDQPTYKIADLVVITLTDNFATALVTNATRDFYVGDIAISKTKEARLREQKARHSKLHNEKEMLGGKALDELDVDLNLEDLNEDLLKEADKIQLTEDELAELERQEREKSVIKDSERDLKSLERLENEIEQAESILKDAKLDEDKLLENQNLNEIEKKQGSANMDSLDEIEENLGKRYLDEDLNSKDNPFGLTEFDVEEIDELLNVEKNQNTESKE